MFEILTILLCPTWLHPCLHLHCNAANMTLFIVLSRDFMPLAHNTSGGNYLATIHCSTKNTNGKSICTIQDVPLHYACRHTPACTQFIIEQVSTSCDQNCTSHDLEICQPIATYYTTIRTCHCVDIYLCSYTSMHGGWWIRRFGWERRWL